MTNDHADQSQPAARPRPAAALLFQAPDPAMAAPKPRRDTDLPAEQAAPTTERAPKKGAAKKDQGADKPAKDSTKKGSSDKDSVKKDSGKKGSAKKESGKKASKKSGKKDKDAPSTEADTPKVSEPETAGEDAGEEGSSHRRRRRRSRRGDDATPTDEITALKGSTRLEAKRRRRREGRRESHRHQAITESEFLARRESVDRRMLIRERDGLNQIAVTEDGLLVEHYVARHTQTTMVGSVYLGKVQNVLPSMEAAFIDLGKGRNAVLYAGEVNWDAAGLSGHPRRIEQALKAGDTVLVQVTKDPIGHKGARLTAQVTLAGRYLVLVPEGAMTGISRKLPENERKRLKKLLKTIVPAGHGVIIRTAAEGATKEQLAADVERLLAQWESIQKKQKSQPKAPVLVHGEPELALRVVRDVFNEDFQSLVIEGKATWKSVSAYVNEYAPDLVDRMEQWTSSEDVFAANRVDEQLAKGMDRKVWLPSGGHLVIDRTEAMTVVDVNTGKYTGGAGGTLEETVTKNNLEAAEEIVRQLRLRDIGGIIVIDFVDMVLPSNRDLVLRRLIECLGRDRTRHQVTEVTSLGLVQMTRKRVGQGLVEAFSTPCEHCEGRGFIVHDDPVEKTGATPQVPKRQRARSDKGQQAARSMNQVAEASKHADSGAGKASELQATKAAGTAVADKKVAKTQVVASGEAGAGEDTPKKPPRRAARKVATSAADTPAAAVYEAANVEVAAEETPVKPAKKAPAKRAKRAAASTTETGSQAASTGALIISDLDDLKASRPKTTKRTRTTPPKDPQIELAEGPATAAAPKRRSRVAQTAPDPQAQVDHSAALIIEG